MTLSILLGDVLALDQLAWLQLLGFATLVVFVARLLYWLNRSLLMNGDVVVEAEQVLHASEMAASFNGEFIPTAGQVAISEARRLPHLGEGRLS